MLLFIDHVLPVVFAHLEIRRELNGVGRAGFFAKSAQDAAGKIDAEKFGIPAAVWVFAFLQGDTIYRANNRTKITGYAAFFAVRVAG